jgi:hypothetical protein
VTAALVSHRPPLTVRADLGSAVAPPPAVQRVAFAGPGEPSTASRPAPTAAVQRTPARVGAPVPGRVDQSPISPESGHQSVAAEPPVVTTSLRTGHPERHIMEPIPVQRQPQLPTMPGRSPVVPATSGAASSFTAMFANAPAGQTEGQPGYTTVPLPTADLSSAASPQPAEPTAALTVPPGETAAPPAAAAPAAAPGAPATAGVAAAQLDEMARQLFEPLSARLRAELWLDRERAGLVTDARH